MAPNVDNIHERPSRLLQAIEVEAWKERLTPNGASISCASMVEWITSPFPRGLESRIETVKAILRSSKNKGEAQRALMVLDRALERPEGNPTGANQHRGTVDNVHGSAAPDRPTGNSEQAGLRRLRKAADKGDEAARGQLDAVLSGSVSTHAACLAMGWRPGRRACPSEVPPAGGAPLLSAS